MTRPDLCGESSFDRLHLDLLDPGVSRDRLVFTVTSFFFRDIGEALKHEERREGQRRSGMIALSAGSASGLTCSMWPPGVQGILISNLHLSCARDPQALPEQDLPQPHH